MMMTPGVNSYGLMGTPSTGAFMPSPGLNAVPPLIVKVEGLSFQYQFTEDDVRKVFSRYGDVVQVLVAHDGASATVYFGDLSNAMNALTDLNGKQLAGINNAQLHVECPSLNTLTSPLLGSSNSINQDNLSTPGLNYNNIFPEGGPTTADMRNQQFMTQDYGSGIEGSGKKYTCRLEIGIANEKEYRVGSKVIQIARKIWQELPSFQKHGGKTRLRGKGVGGPHESDEPLALCISCKDATCFEQAVQFAEQQIGKIHEDYRKYCSERGYATPILKPVKAICDHPHTSAPWHQAKFDHHTPFNTGGNMQQKHSGSYTGNGSLESKFSQGGGYPQGYGMPQQQYGFQQKQQQDRGERPPGAPDDAEIERFIEERNEARKGGNFTRADEIRDTLKNRGVVLMDDKGARGNKKGTQVTKWRYWNP